MFDGQLKIYVPKVSLTPVSQSDFLKVIFCDQLLFLSAFYLLILFLEFFGNFFIRNSLTFNTLVFLSSFCRCLIFHLKKFLWDVLLSSIFSSWSRKTYGFTYPLCFWKKSCASWSYVPCGQVLVCLVSTWAFPKTKLRPEECGLGSSRVSFAL